MGTIYRFIYLHIHIPFLLRELKVAYKRRKHINKPLNKHCSLGLILDVLAGLSDEPLGSCPSAQTSELVPTAMNKLCKVLRTGIEKPNLRKEVKQIKGKDVPLSPPLPASSGRLLE